MLKRLRKQVFETGRTPAKVVSILREAGKAIEEQIPFIPEGDTPEDKARSVIAYQTAQMVPDAAAMLERVKREEKPSVWWDIFFRNVEYLLPKLAKQEVSGSIAHSHGIFVPVEQRPISLLENEDGVFRESSE